MTIHLCTPAFGAVVRAAGACLLLAAVAAHAQTSVTITDAWVRGTVAQQKATGAFMQLRAERTSRLLSVATPVAGTVEIHEMAMDGDVMRMRAVPAVELPAGQRVDLKPGGYHVMLLDLKRPLKAGESVPMTLVVEGADGRRESLQVNAAVRPLGAAPMDAMDGTGGHGATPKP